MMVKHKQVPWLGKFLVKKQSTEAQVKELSGVINDGCS